jgi:hypothetical protein
MMREMREIAAHLAPGLDERALERCVFSITGQAVFYRFTMPALLRLLDLPAYPPASRGSSEPHHGLLPGRDGAARARARAAAEGRRAS